MDRERALRLFELSLAVSGAALTKWRLELLDFANLYGLGRLKVLGEHFGEAAVMPFLIDLLIRVTEREAGVHAPTWLRRASFGMLWGGYVCAEMITEGVLQPILHSGRPVQVEQLAATAAGTALGVFAFAAVHRWARTTKTLPDPEA